MAVRRRGSQARRHPRHRVQLPPSRHVPFEELVERALAGLPANVQRLLANVAIVIEDEPADPDEDLYGLYEGTALTAYGADWAELPNKITLFRLPLEADFPDPDELANEVRRTVIHELAHHAGIDDMRLDELHLG